MLRSSSAHLQEYTVVYMHHMVLSLSTRVRGDLSVQSLSEINSWCTVRKISSYEILCQSSFIGDGDWEPQFLGHSSLNNK